MHRQLPARHRPLAPPTPRSVDDAGDVERAGASFAPQSARFGLPKSRVYTQQYSHIYTKRLLALRPLVLEAAKQKWGSTGEAAGEAAAAPLWGRRAAAADSAAAAAAAASTADPCASYRPPPQQGRGVCATRS